MWVLQAVTPGLRILVAVVFLSYGLSKLQHLSRFRAVVRQHRILPDKLSSVVAVILPFVEVGLGFLFLFNIAPVLAGFGISAALLLFSAILIRALLQPQLHINDCGCNSIATDRPNAPRKALFRNAILLVMTVVVVGLSRISEPTVPFVFLLAELAVFAITVVTQIGIVQASWFRQFRLQRVSDGDVRISRSQARSPIEREQRQLLPTLARGSRRSFLRWSLGIGLGVLVGLADHQSQAFAYAGCNCSCYEDCYDIQDCSGCPVDGPVYE